MSDEPTNRDLMSAILALSEAVDYGFTRAHSRSADVEARRDAKTENGDASLRRDMHRRFDRLDDRFDRFESRLLRLEGA